MAKQTKEEKMTMYMKLSKKELAEMLINCNEMLNKQLKTSNININHQQQDYIACDNCGCHPNTIYRTEKGTFCKECAGL